MDGITPVGKREYQNMIQLTPCVLGGVDFKKEFDQAAVRAVATFQGRGKLPEREYESSEEVFMELAKLYNLTEMYRRDFTDLLKDLRESGLITDREWLHAGNVVRVDPALNQDPEEACKTVGPEKPFNPLEEYESSYLDYVQNSGYADSAVLREAVLAHNKVGELLQKIAGYAGASQ